MGLLLTCLSLVLSYFSPKEVLPALAPYRLELLMLVSAIAVSAVTMATRRDSGLQPPQYLLMLGLWIAVVASHVAKLKFRWGLESLSQFGVLVAIYFLVALNTFTLPRIKAIAMTLIGCGVLLGIQAILAYHTGYLGGTLLLFQPGDMNSYLGNRVRGFGFLQDPNDFAQFLLVCVALLGIFWKKGRGPFNLIKLGPVAVVLIYAAYLTFSRGGLLGLASILFFAMYRKTRRLISFAVSAMGTLVLYALRYTGGREMNVESGRLMAWGAGISAILHRPIFGVGFGHFTDINDLTAHNSFVLCMAELGLFGYFFWMALLLTTFMGIGVLWNLEAKTPEDEEFQAAVYAIRAALACFLVTGWFLSRTYTETLYILLALAHSLIYMRRSAVPQGTFHVGKWAPRTLVLELASIAIVYVMIRVRVL